tara:strand:+ start:431 stop:1072 length:642 start_codon:yes stop_codon:yes gene_type:complete
MKDLYWASKPKEGDEAPSKEKTPIIVLNHDDGSGGQHAVDVQNNIIYFYGVVDDGNIKLLNRALRHLDKESQIFTIKYGCEAPPIELHINSYGGSLFSAFAVVDTLSQLKTPVHSYIDGSAASAATLISCCTTKRYMSRNSYMLIHQLSSSVWGKFEEIKDEMENLEMLMENIKRIYTLHTSIPKRELDKILKRDLWLDHEKCLKWGLVDEII